MCAARDPSGHSDSRRELHALLLRVEEAHRADIFTYSSGHLNPNRLSQKAPIDTAKEPKWTGSFAPAKVAVTAASVTADSPHPEKGAETSPPHIAGSHSDTFAKYRQVYGNRDQRRTRREFERSVLKIQDLREPKGLGWSQAAGKQERRLEQVLKKLCAESRLGRERLHIFSGIFGDVCNGSQVFGQILREIKTEYDLYLNSVLSSHSNPQNTAQMVPFRCRPNQSHRLFPLTPGATSPGDLNEARDEVLRLGYDARKALVDNDQVRMELKRERDQAQHINGVQNQVDQQDSKQGEVLVTPSDQVRNKRREVLAVLEEVRLLENVIRKQMVPKDTIRATERYIRDLEAEITALSASKKRLCEAYEDLQSNISSLMDKAKITKEIQGEFWKNVWGTLRHEDKDIS
ncbi:hypothetical protein SKAU_G00163600 [Synaphobranchus kaupii]|uniref:Translin-associated factor X-interacting protein 1 N-terminal domain-containing protein n=1 Tax=Synaphobranchus kaupii TaxID=118154 RepID=A0A9Q1J003_SYNKA|nr:hypothetical protein SKAU_G00163600 [Synaphobranchus kaupii]